MDSTKAISVKNLSVLFNGDRTKHLHVLENVSFNISQGEFVSIIGPSGCGKSTLFRLISGLPTRDSCEIEGTVRIYGMKPETASKEREIGLILQKPTLLEWRNVSENIKLPLEIMGYKKEKMEKKVAELLEILELESFSHYSPSELSGGMQQKVSIGRALAYNPKLLLMDEPFAALDEVNRRKMNDEIIRIWKEMKKTILFVTHNIQEAVYLSQRVIVLSKKPAKVHKIVDIDLEYPRSEVEGSSKYFKYIKEIRQYLNEASI
jgi:NitT/TauT family transport system ATP-binding protein